MKKAAIYARVSTDDQNADRQERDLKAFAERAGFEVVLIVKETASGAKNDRKQRARVMKMAQNREIEAVLVTELSRWGRSTQDLISTLDDLAAVGCSVIPQTGMSFDLSTANGKLMRTIFAGLCEFERDLLRERVKSGISAAKARGKHCGRPEGSKTSDKWAPAVLKHIEEGRSYRWIEHEMQISKTTVVSIVKRHQLNR